MGSVSDMKNTVSRRTVAAAIAALGGFLALFSTLFLVVAAAEGWMSAVQAWPWIVTSSILFAAPIALVALDYVQGRSNILRSIVGAIICVLFGTLLTYVVSIPIIELAALRNRAFPFFESSRRLHLAYAHDKPEFVAFMQRFPDAEYDSGLGYGLWSAHSLDQGTQTVWRCQLTTNMTLELQHAIRRRGPGGWLSEPVTVSIDAFRSLTREIDTSNGMERTETPRQD